MPQSLLRITAIPSLVLAMCLTGIALAASDLKPSANISENLEKARRDAEAIQAAITALPAQCTLGNARDATQWIDSRDAAGAPGAPYTYDFAFKAPVRAGAFHVALNARAVRNLEKIETLDAQGKWNLAWTGIQTAVPIDCEFVEIAQRFASGEREVTALRIIVHPDQEKIVVANAGVLKAD